MRIFFGMFIWFSIGFVSSIFSLYQLADWPNLVWLLPGLVMAIIAFFMQFNRVVQFVSGGIIGWIWLACWLFFSPQLAPGFMNQPVWLTGNVDSFVVEHISENSHFTVSRFEFTLSDIESESDHQAWWFRKPKIRLSCYNCSHQFDINQSWRFKAKLKPIHGSMNPGGFDYEAWAHYQGLQARGYILAEQDAQYLGAILNFQSLRQAFANRLKPLLASSSFEGIYSALLFADRQAINGEQWEVLQKTGTIHLMAISGLHIALVGLMGFALGRWLWRVPIKRFEYWPVQWFGAGGALVAVTLYSVLAGFSIPTQRAWIMALVMIGFLFWRRKLQFWPMLMLAAFLVVAWQPGSVLSQGFWLSFLAVALIFSWLSLPWARKLKGWQSLLAVQWVLSLGLMPALWWFYQQVPVYSLLANLIAVPFVSFIGLPLLFIIALIELIAPGLVMPLLKLSDLLWRGVWWFLNMLTEWSFGYWVISARELWQVVLIYCVLFTVVLWRNVRFIKSARLGWVLLALVVWFWPITSQQLQSQDVRISLLDVGQGQALVIETADHVLVYDTGPSFGDRFNGASIAITPYLRHQGWQKIDRLLVSHADQDHAGGTEQLLKDWVVDEKYSGQPKRLGLPGFEDCHTLEPWQWNGVQFGVISVRPFNPMTHNDLSCVLTVSVDEHRFIVTGDLSSQFENQLLQLKSAEEWKTQVVVAGHHGSRYSSSSQWLAALEPDYLLFSAGYLNRYGFPHPDVVARAEQQDIKMLNTACEGAIQFKLEAQQGWQLENRARISQKRWFHQACIDE